MILHPFLCLFFRKLNRFGVDGLLHRDTQIVPKNDFFVEQYEPSEGLENIWTPYPLEEVDFNAGGTYSQYNWELFFHAPFLLAKQLTNNQRFEEAQKWYHYIFDPTNTSDEDIPKRYWITKPFYEKEDEDYEKEKIKRLMRKLAGDWTDFNSACRYWPGGRIHSIRI